MIHLVPFSQSPQYISDPNMAAAKRTYTEVPKRDVICNGSIPSRTSRMASVQFPVVLFTPRPLTKVVAAAVLASC